jgi:hypothetical protein
MRFFCVVSVALLAFAAIPATGHAATPPAPPAGTAFATPGCHCPGLRPHRIVRVHIRHRRWAPPVAVAAPPPLPAAAVYYEPGIPSPWDTAYDRGMVLHFRSPDVSGFYFAEAGYPDTPEIVSVQPYRVVNGKAVSQYDGVIGDYVPLAAYDAERLAPVPVPER